MGSEMLCCLFEAKHILCSSRETDNLQQRPDPCASALQKSTSILTSNITKIPYKKINILFHPKCFLIPATKFSILHMLTFIYSSLAETKNLFIPVLKILYMAMTCMSYCNFKVSQRFTKVANSVGHRHNTIVSLTLIEILFHLQMILWVVELVD